MPTPERDEHQTKLVWIAKTASDTIAPDHPDLHPPIEKTVLEVLLWLDTLCQPRLCIPTREEDD